MKKTLIVLVAGLVFSASAAAASPQDLSPTLKSKIAFYKQKLQRWAADPAIVQAVLRANRQKPKLDNARWKALPTDSSTVMHYTASSLGRKLAKLQRDRNLGKLFLRDRHGNLVAGSRKPAIFNIAKRAPYVHAMRGKSWAADRINTDPTTKTASVQIAVPVMHQGKPVGVLHASIRAQR